MKRIFFKLILTTASMFLLSACVRATERLNLHTGLNPAVVEVATNEIKVLNIDSMMVDIRHMGDQGSPYYCVALSPGTHSIVTKCRYFREGNVFFLQAALKGGHRYLIKTKVLGREKKMIAGIPMPTSQWRVYVWVEDAETGQMVSRVIKNI